MYVYAILLRVNECLGRKVGRKEMFYLTTHSTHVLRLYGVEHMVKDYSDGYRGNPLPPLYGILFYMHYSVDRMAHTTAFVTPVMEF